MLTSSRIWTRRLTNAACCILDFCCLEGMALQRTSRSLLFNCFWTLITHLVSPICLKSQSKHFSLKAAPMGLWLQPVPCHPEGTTYSVLSPSLCLDAYLSPTHSSILSVSFSISFWNQVIWEVWFNFTQFHSIWWKFTTWSQVYWVETVSI